MKLLDSSAADHTYNPTRMTESQKEPIGFIGLGVMGKPMALNLVKAGYSLTVYDIKSESTATLVAAGAKKSTSTAGVAEQSDIIITMLPDSPQGEEVILGNKGIIETARPGSLGIDMSSIAPGGWQKDFERASGILHTLGASAMLMGKPGSGNVTKLANQILVALHLAAMGEAMVFAEKAGVDCEKVYKAIRGGLAGSAVLDAKIPLILERNFKPGGPIRMHTKDLVNVRDTAFEIDAPIPLTTQVMEMMKALKADGKGEDDHGGLIQYHEKLAGVTVRKKT